MEREYSVVVLYKAGQNKEYKNNNYISVALMESLSKVLCGILMRN